MTNYATWAASHPLYWIIGLPVLAALLANALWQLLGHLPPGRRRSALYIGFGLSMLAIFVVLALAIGDADGSLVGFDNALAQSLGLSMSTELLWVLSWFTHLGDRNWLALLAILMVAGLAFKRQWWLAACGVAATAGGGALNWLLKHAFQRARPEFDHGIEVSGFSFPSGHASASLAVYGFACYLLLRLLPEQWRALCVALTAALVAAIGVSRVLLHVHFFSDVVAGFAISGLWLALCVTVTERRLRQS